MTTDSTLGIIHKTKPVSIGGRGAFRSFADLWALTKPEINFLIAITVLVSFLIAHKGSHLPPVFSLFNTMIGALLVSSGAAALNQFMEQRFDSQMRRTSRRPLVMGSIAPRYALLFGASASVLGLSYLEQLVNPLSSIIAGLTSVIYLGAYTPLKRITPFCTLVGAIPGAAPPLIGWAGATGTLTRGAWALYALLFLWQLPHFMAIAWMYRDDYERAGYRVLPDVKKRRLFAAIQSVIPAILMIPVSLMPWVSGEAGHVYLICAALLGLCFAFLALRFGLKTTNKSARHLLLASICHG